MKKMKLNIQLFAVTKNTSFSENVDIVNNKSDLSIKITFSANNSSTWFNSKALKCTCNGSTQSKNVSLSKGGKVTATFTFEDIQHNNDGSKSVDWNWSVTTGTSVLGKLSDSGTKQLTTIPRASDITATNADIGSSSIIVINKKNDSFTTTLKYKFATQTVYTTIVEKTAEKTYGWQVPTSFYSLIPNAQYGSCSIEAITYNGDIQIGDPKYVDINIFANEMLCKPAISNTSIIDTNTKSIVLTGDNTKFIKYVSTPKLTWNASAKNGATLKSQTINNVSTTSPYQTNWADSFKLDVTDSRNYTNTYNYVLSNVVDYFYPQITASGKRKTSTSSNIILNLNGKFFNGYFSENIKNTATFKCNYKKKDDSGWSTITLTPTITPDGTFALTDFDLGEICDYKYSWQFSITVTDKITSQSSNFPIIKGDPIYYWYIKEKINHFKVNGKFNSTNTATVKELISSKNVEATDGFLITKKFGKTTKIGSENSGYCHYMTDADRNYFNKPLYVQGDLFGGENYDKKVAYFSDLLSANNVLWGPDYYFMSGSNTINLSQKVSEQKNGIVLVWQAYSDGAPQPWEYNFTFIPKWQAITNSSRGVVCFLATSHASYIGTKYVYVFDDKVTGHNDNSTGPTKGNSGITTTNNHWVLTYVIGV